MIATNGPHFLPMKFGGPASAQRHRTTGHSIFNTFGIERGLVDILDEVNQLTIRFSTNFHSTSPDEGLLVLGQLSSILQRLLQPPPIVIDNNDPALVGLSESCRYAGALHVVFPLMGHYPDPILMVNALVHKLKDSLMYFIPFAETANLVLLWCLTVGAVSACQMPERNWFIGHIIGAVTDLDITNWEEMRSGLEGVMTHAVFCDNSFALVWSEVVERANS
jgi:hypothetical protein